MKSRGKRKRDIKEEAGMAFGPLLSQPLGKVFREYSFSGIFFALLPVMLLYSHQPTIILNTQTCK